VGWEGECEEEFYRGWAVGHMILDQHLSSHYRISEESYRKRIVSID
jgi:hypothetical protein